MLRNHSSIGKASSTLIAIALFSPLGKFVAVIIRFLRSAINEASNLLFGKVRPLRICLFIVRSKQSLLQIPINGCPRLLEPFGSLSKGEKQQFAAAYVIAHIPSISCEII